MAKRKVITKAKACKILHDKTIRGKPITAKQRRFMGARCSGQPIKRKR